jgi:tetratricopeptide (TPR) repeat protein
MLHPRNHAQARLEYRLACLEDALTCAAPEMLSLVGSYEEALELVPNGERGAAVLEFLINGVLTRLPSSAARLERELRARDPSALGPLRRIATAAASDLSNEDAWCSDELRADCIAQGAEAAHTLVLAAPLLCDGYQLTAFFKRAAGDTVGAFDQFEAAVPLVEHPGRCAQHLLELARETKESALVDRAVARMENSSCDTPEECAENLVLAARAESMRGNRKRALVLLQKAWEIRENDQLLDEIGETAEAEGLHAQAAEAYTKLTARHPDDPTWTKKLDRARTAATAQRFQPPRLSPPARD